MMYVHGTALLITIITQRLDFLLVYTNLSLSSLSGLVGHFVPIPSRPVALSRGIIAAVKRVHANCLTVLLLRACAGRLRSVSFFDASTCVYMYTICILERDCD
jgi:hypothetical protein